jgi:predicted HicB family RNase H-like nuclease
MSRLPRQSAEEIEQLEDELGYQSDQWEEEKQEFEEQRQELEATRHELEVTRQKLTATKQELRAERQKHTDLANEAAATLRKVEDAVIRVTIQLEFRNDLEATGLTSLATQLHNIERLAALTAEGADQLASAKENVQRLVDRTHFQSVNTVLACLCDGLGLHTQLVAELVLNEFAGQDYEVLPTIENTLHAIEAQQTLIQNDCNMDPTEKDRLLHNLVASVWVQVMAGNKFPFDRLIVPRCDLDILQLVDPSGDEDLYERVREELEPRPEGEAP